MTPMNLFLFGNIVAAKSTDMSLSQISVSSNFFQEKENTLSSSTHPILTFPLDLICSNFVKRLLLGKEVLFPKANTKNNKKMVNNI